MKIKIELTPEEGAALQDFLLRFDNSFEHDAGKFLPKDHKYLLNDNAVWSGSQKDLDNLFSVIEKFTQTKFSVNA